MRLWTILALGLCLIAPRIAGAADEEGVGGSDFHKNDITYSTEVETPHVDWASQLPGGPVRGFFIPTIRYGRDMVELMQRLDLEPTTVSIDPNWDVNCWGIGDYYGHRFRGDRDDYETVFGYVERDLTSHVPFEVIVIPDVNGWSRMTKPTRDAILKRVQDGAGLVLVHPTVGDVEGRPFKGDPPEGDIRIWDISPLVESPSNPINEGGYPDHNANPALTEGCWEAAADHFITRGVPLGLLPEASVPNMYYRYKANGKVLVKSGDDPIIAVRTYGLGRVVAMAYHNQCFTPRAPDPVETGIYWNYWEYYYSLLARSILWAARGEPAVVVESTGTGDPLRGELALHLRSSQARRVTIEVAARTEYGKPIVSYESVQDLEAGENDVMLSAGEGPEGVEIGGKVICDFIIRQEGATLDWGTTFVELPRRATLTALRPAEDVYRRGGVLAVAAEAEGDLEGLEAHFAVEDELGRLVHGETVPAAPEMAFTCPLDHYLGDYAFVSAELVAPSGYAVDRMECKGVLVVQNERRRREFRALLSFAGGGRPFFRNLRGRLVRAAGAKPGFVWGGAVNTGLNIPKGTFGVYWYDRGPFDEEGIEKEIAIYEATGDFQGLKYNVKKALYERTGDKKFLRRVPCFDDDDFMARLRRTVTQAAASKSKYNFDYYFVGDEGSLTSYTDPFDFCWEAHTLAAFRKWLFHEYGSLAALNREWKSNFAEWDQVVPFTTDEALETGNFAPWADHRTWMEITFADAYRTVREGVVAGDPEGHIAVSGTQVTKAYNGCDWYRLDRIIDDFLSYGGGNQWDLHRSFAKPGSMIGFWTGYGSDGIAVQNAIWTAAVHNVLHPNIFWMYCYLDPDFTYSDSARDMGVAFKDLKFEGIAKLLMESERLHDGIALHYSMPSVHAASITFNEPERGRKPEEVKRNFTADRDGWVTTIKDLGLQFDFLSYDQVETGSLATGEYRVFIMPFSMALSPDEVEEITAFAENGGIVIADAAAGVMNEHCTWVDEGLLSDLFGIRTRPSASRDYNGLQGPVEITPTGERWRLDADALEGLEAAEKDLDVAGGTALATVGGAPVAVVRRVGKGWAVYLNVIYDRYPRLRRRDFGGSAYRDLMRAIFAHLDVRGAVEVLAADGSPLQQALVARYSIGESEVVAVVKENVRLAGIEGFDGVTVYDDSQLGRIARQEITLRLPRAAYVSDVRAGLALGFSEVVDTAITVGGAEIIALSPVENALAIEGPASVKRGEHAVFTVKSAAASRRVARCHFHDADGRFVPHYANNIVIEGGEAQVVLPTALNDAAGTWRLEITDLLTAAKAEVSFDLE